MTDNGNGKVRIIGIINNFTLKRDRRGKGMAFFTLEDLESEIEVITFSSLYEECSSYLRKDEIVLVKGRLDTAGRSPKVIAEKITPFSKLKDVSHNLHIKVRGEKLEEETLKKLKGILSSHKGKYTVYLHLAEPSGKEVTIRSKSLKVDSSDALISEVKELLGERSIWLNEN
jgi:DNA polymerase-3 subunit alpha